MELLVKQKNYSCEIVQKQSMHITVFSHLCYGKIAINYQVDLKAGDGNFIHQPVVRIHHLVGQGAGCKFPPFDPLPGFEYTFYIISKACKYINHKWLML